MPAGSFIAGLDLGQAHDYTALVIPEVTHRVTAGRGGKHYDVRHIERFPLGTAYPDIVAGVQARLSQLWERGAGAALVADKTGVGAPVVDLFKQAGVRPLAPVTITAGDWVTHDPEEGFRVTKRDLVLTVRVLLESGRLRIAAALPEAATLTEELLAFRVRISAAGRDTYGADGADDLAWRERPHDDLVLALALACWYGEHGPKSGLGGAAAALTFRFKSPWLYGGARARESTIQHLRRQRGED